MTDTTLKEDVTMEAAETQEAGAVMRMESQTGTAVTPMELLNKAVSAGADVERLEKLMLLQERWEASEARKAFVAAFAAFKAEAPTINKNKHVGFSSQKGRTDYDHATLDNVADKLSPILAKHGLTYSYKTRQDEGGKIFVTCVLTHIMGHSEETTLHAGADNSGNKNSIQAVGSTVTFLQRYTLLAACGIATKGQDDDAGKTHDEPTISAEQKDQIIAKMKEVGADTTGFLRYMKVETVDDLPAKEFGRAMKALENKASQKKEQSA